MLDTLTFIDMSSSTKPRRLLLRPIGKSSCKKMNNVNSQHSSIQCKENRNNHA